MSECDSLISDEKAIQMIFPDPRAGGGRGQLSLAQEESIRSGP